MQEHLSKTLLDQFENNLNASFEEYRKKHKKNITETIQFIQYLIDHKLIKHTTIRRYAILKEHEKLANQKNLKKVEIIRTLSNRFNLSERTVYNVLKEYRNYFDKN